MPVTTALTVLPIAETAENCADFGPRVVGANATVNVQLSDAASVLQAFAARVNCAGSCPPAETVIPAIVVAPVRGTRELGAKPCLGRWSCRWRSD